MSRPTGLVLQGGGARGAFECGVIKHLYGSVPGFGINAITGVSIGAINAACLVGGLSRRELGMDSVGTTPSVDPADHTAPWAVEALWEKLKLRAVEFLPSMLQSNASLLGHPRFYWPRTDYPNLLSWTSYYDTWPLKGLLEDLIDFEKLNHPQAPALTIVALDVESGKPVEFSNFGDRAPITPEQVMASGSLPPGFPMTQIGAKSFWDGGLFDNTPLKPIIDALAALPPESSPAPDPTWDGSRWSDEMLVYLVQLIPTQGVVPKDLMEVQERMNQVIFSNKSQDDADRAKQINAYLTLLRNMVSGLPPDQIKRIQELSDYQKVACHRPVRLVPINMTGSGASLGGSDFSVGTIEARIAEGIAATQSALADHPPDAVPWSAK